MKIGLHICDFAPAGGPGRLGAEFAAVVRTADEAGLRPPLGHGPPLPDRHGRPGRAGDARGLHRRWHFSAAHTSRAQAARSGDRRHVPASRHAASSRSPHWTSSPAGEPCSASARPGTRRRRSASGCRSRRWPRGSSGWRRRCASPGRCSPAIGAVPRASITGSSDRSTRPLRCLAAAAHPGGRRGRGRPCAWSPSTPTPATCSTLRTSARKLDVLREHCDREGRDYDEIEKTCTLRLDVRNGAGPAVAELRRLAELGLPPSIVDLPDIWGINALETVGTGGHPGRRGTVVDLTWGSR